MNKNSPYYNIFPDLPIEYQLQTLNILRETFNYPKMTMAEFLKVRPLPNVTPKSTKGGK